MTARPAPVIQLDRVPPLVREAVRQAIWEESLKVPECHHSLGPPSDVDSEERIVSALLCGHTTLPRIAPLRSRDFLSPLCRGVVAVLETAPGADLARVVLGMEALGYCGPLVDQLLEIRDRVPFVVDLTECIVSVHETARRRRLIAWLRELDADLSTGSATVADGLNRMRAALK